jgi:hypothetical protein
MAFEKRMSVGRSHGEINRDSQRARRVAVHAVIRVPPQNDARSRS